MTTAFERLIAGAGVRRVRFHDLRHGVASMLLAQGVPMKVISETLGHSTMAITSDTYSHVARELRLDVAEKIGAALFG